MDPYLLAFLLMLLSAVSGYCFARFLHPTPPQSSGNPLTGVLTMTNDANGRTIELPRKLDAAALERFAWLARTPEEIAQGL